MIIRPLAPTDFACAARLGGARRALRAGADDDGDARLHEALDALLALVVGQQRPVSHRAAINDAAHAGRDQALARADQRLEVGPARRSARRHQGRDGSLEDVLAHARSLSDRGRGSQSALAAVQVNGSWCWLRC